MSRRMTAARRAAVRELDELADDIAASKRVHQSRAALADAVEALLQRQRDLCVGDAEYLRLLGEVAGAEREHRAAVAADPLRLDDEPRDRRAK